MGGASLLDEDHVGGSWNKSFACSMHHLYLEAGLMMLVTRKYDYLFLSLILSFRFSTSSAFRDLIQISPFGSLQISVQAVTIQQQYLIMKLWLVYLWQSWLKCFLQLVKLLDKISTLLVKINFTQLMVHWQVLRNYSSSCPKMLQYLPQVHIAVKYKWNWKKNHDCRYYLRGQKYGRVASVPVPCRNKHDFFQGC